MRNLRVRLIGILPWVLWLVLIQDIDLVRSKEDPRPQPAIDDVSFCRAGEAVQSGDSSCCSRTINFCDAYSNDGDTRVSSSKRSRRPPGFNIFTYGTAQSYKPHQPIQSTICDPEIYSAAAGDKTNTQPRKKKSKYLVANWPFSRSSRLAAVPVQLRLRMYSCAPSKSTTPNDPICCCQQLDLAMRARQHPYNVTGSIEIWQARPDGSYSSLRPGIADGDCRARMILGPSSLSLVEFVSVAPGSTGALGGLGPNRLDFMPYGPPAIHALVKVAHHAPALINIPILVGKNLQPTRFAGPDWRGPAWVQPIDKRNSNMKRSSPSSSSSVFNITAWKSDNATNAVELEVEVFLRQQDRDSNDEAILSSSSLWVQFVSKTLCQSWVYGFPSSFFLEPIALCAPSILDFFAL